MSLALNKLLRFNYRKALFFIRSTRYCIVFGSGAWLVYQIRQTSLLLDSVVPTQVLNLDHSHVQYIYLDDPRYQDIFMFKHAIDLDLSIKDNPKSISYKLTRWWKTVNRNFALRLLGLARIGDVGERKRAVEALVSSQHLKDWHYCQIAQMLDARTAVSLSRYPGTDLRFFLKPPYFNLEYKLHDIIEKLHNLLLTLNSACNSSHPCLLQFLQKKFQDSTRDTPIFENDASIGGITVSPPIIWDLDFLETCIHAVHHHSALEEHSKDVVDAGGLQLLMKVYRHVGDNVEICILLAKILSNLSLFSEYLEEIFMAGWIGVLAAWSRHKDIRLASPAARALRNLDSDDNNNEKYPQRIFPIYPLHRVPFKHNLDMIFIHGLLGGVFVTWRQRENSTACPGPADHTGFQNLLNVITGENPPEFLNDLAHDLRLREWQRVGHDCEVIYEDCPVNLSDTSTGPFFCKGDDQCMRQFENDCQSKTQCWPKDWLPEDIPKVRIIGINYNTNLSMWTPLCPIEGVRSTIRERSNEFTKKLATAGVGKRPVIWVCHSMGGLLVKQMLVEEWKSGDKNNLVQNTRGIVFYSTPHRGSQVAALKQTTQLLLWPSMEVQELRKQSSQLLKLHEDFLEMLKENKIDIISFGETKSTLVTALKVPLRFVDSESADPGVGEFFEIPQDHMSICKPAHRLSFLYQKVLSMIRRHIETSE